MASHGKRTGRGVWFSWRAYLNDKEDRAARDVKAKGESNYAFTKIAIVHEVERRRSARQEGESDGNTNEGR